MFSIGMWSQCADIKYLFHKLKSSSFNRLLTHWGRVTQICISNLTIIGSDNDLSPGRRQAINWTNAGILSIGNLGTNFSEILIEILAFSFKNLHLKVSSGKWRPCCLGPNVLTLLVLKLKYSQENMVNTVAADALAPCIPRSEQPWYWPFKMNGSLSTMRKDFNYILRLSDEKSLKI